MPIFLVENSLGAYDKVEDDGSIQDDDRIDYMWNKSNKWKKQSVMVSI